MKLEIGEGANSANIVWIPIFFKGLGIFILFEAAVTQSVFKSDVQLILNTPEVVPLFDDDADHSSRWR